MTQTCYNNNIPELLIKISAEDAQLILKLNNFGVSNIGGYATAQETRTDIKPELPDDHLTSSRYVIHAVTAAKYASKVTMPTCATWIEILV